MKGTGMPHAQWLRFSAISTMGCRSSGMINRCSGGRVWSQRKADLTWDLPPRQVLQASMQRLELGVQVSKATVAKFPGPLRRMSSRALLGEVCRTSNKIWSMTEILSLPSTLAWRKTAVHLLPQRRENRGIALVPVRKARLRRTAARLYTLLRRRYEQSRNSDLQTTTLRRTDCQLNQIQMRFT